MGFDISPSGRLTAASKDGVVEEVRDPTIKGGGGALCRTTGSSIEVDLCGLDQARHVRAC